MKGRHRLWKGASARPATQTGDGDQLPGTQPSDGGGVGLPRDTVTAPELRHDWSSFHDLMWHNLDSVAEELPKSPSPGAALHGLSSFLQAMAGRV